MSKKLPVILGLGAAACAAGAYYYVIDYFFKLGFNARFKPVAPDDGFADNTDYRDQVLAGKKWLLETEHEVIDITNPEGLKLRGHYFPAANAKRTVICFHGWRAKWYYDFAVPSRNLLDRNCNILLVEQRSQGNSEGDFMGFGVSEHLDVPVWVDYLIKNKPDGLPIYIYGRSMGASTVMMAAGKPLPDEVAGIIADCGFSDPVKMLSHFCENSAHLPAHPFVDSVIRMIRRRTGVDVSSFSALTALKCATKPILFIHGDADGFVPMEMTMEDYEACASPKKLLIVKGADHCMSDLVDHDAYYAAVEEFFREFS
ncbi:MAG: alpha/beta hydrolase [Lachnospiraceae bacterium]|nr:alpha/beta hydrolase [Lachnospiraceae bacterium]